MATVAVCGVACVSTRGTTAPLDRVLESLGPFGDRREQVQSSVAPLTAIVGARWSGRERPLVRSTAPDGLVVVADARLANPDRLAVTLGAPGASAVELIAAAYRRWDDDWPRHVDGAFAAAVVDPRRSAVSLYADHVAQRPLAYWSRGDQLAFASTALALTSLDGVGHELDTDRAREALALVPSSRTFVRGVRMVEAGGAVAITPAGVRRWRWWEPERIAVRDLGSLDRHADELRHELDAAVRNAVDGVDRVGVSLSGGLDSTSVAATVATLRAPEVVHTYTSAPPEGWVASAPTGRDPDESPLVRLLAERYPNLRPRFVGVEGRDVFEEFEPLWELGAPPVRNVMNALWVRAIYQEASADGVEVLLTGSLGNFAFSADGPRVLVELLRRGRVVSLAREARARAVRRSSSTRHVLRTELVDLVAPPLRARGDSVRGADRRIVEWFGATALRAEQAELVDVGAGLPVLGDRDDTRWTRRPEQVFAATPATAVVDLAVRAWYGVEVCDPTVARGLLETALAQPEWWRRHQGITRAVARRAMADRLPPAIVRRTVRGAQLPDWFDRLAEVRSVVDVELEAARDHPASRELIDIERLTTLVREWPSSADAHRAQVVNDYRLALVRALNLSRYLRWFDQRARRVAAGGPVVVLPVR